MTIEKWLVVLPCVLRLSDVRPTFAPLFGYDPVAITGQGTSFRGSGLGFRADKDASYLTCSGVSCDVLLGLAPVPTMALQGE